MTDDPSEQVPSDYRILLPEGWFRLALEPDRRAASVDALVDRQLRGIDNQPQLRGLLRTEMLERAENAYRGGGIELYLSLQQAGGLTIPASLLITLLTPPPGRGLPKLKDLGAALAADGEAKEVSMLDLNAGSALRVRREIAPSGEEGDYAQPSVTVDYQLDIPGGQGQLLLTFSTPLIQIADAMTELFDAVAGSLTWSTS
ncbi:hypothetical protein HUT18_26410 [Streptomyces sp. NA04227]|uniref:hypothetical protein n=1 Tax=Streptomyces sp. NA04227 TaxID=2742136 RepID=UPI00158FB724|nr:hypothetical protein [Streptomyces sp. NA04227]QKW09396.1 hypothetical protein HUT18_26410 [Streptomyces sp. NA04227]